MTHGSGPGRHNLPAETTRLVGRERDMAELAALLPGERLVTLAGPGGIGKTRLARHLAAGVAGRFPGGAWLVPLADVRDARLVPQAVAAAVGVAEEPGRAPADTLLAALRARGMLLVLDNCEHLVQDCAAFAHRLLGGCPALHVLATSREPLRVPGEVVWRVPPLDLPAETVTDVDRIGGHAAIRLFAERAAAARPGFGLTSGNAPVVVRLARGLDGMPLALELAAARVGFLTVEQIADRLDERFRLLVRGSRTAAARQRTLRATVDWSHDLLGADERVLLRRLSVFAGGWTLESAERVCGDGLDVLDVLGDLAAKSLVVTDEPARHRLLETIRHYAAERLASSGEADAVAARHRGHMVELAERLERAGWLDPFVPWERRLAAFEAVKAESENLRAAFDAAMRAGDVRAGLRLCTSLRWYWLIQGRVAEGVSWFERCFALPGPVEPAVRARACRAYGEVCYDHGDYDEARARVGEAREAFQALGDRAGVDGCLTTLALIGMRCGDDADAETVLDGVRRRAHTGGEPFNEALALSALAALSARHGRLRTAARLNEESLTIFRRMGHLGLAANTLIGLGLIALVQGDPDRAARFYREAHGIVGGPDGLRPQRARCLAGLGAAATALGDLGTARLHLDESLRLTGLTGRRNAVARVLELCAALALREGDDARAVELLGSASALRERAGVPGSPSTGARQETLLEDARTRLGPPAVAHLWARGRGMEMDEAIARATAPSSPATAPSASPDADTDAPPGAGTRPVRPASTLTPRELEVAALLAAGLTNREIAAELVISPGTAGRHVANILGRLGFGSRAQVAAWWAARHRDGREPDG
ncbi:MAG TPA: LuxR C-terminal-related transcriptional regulator [Spirillospora sp.]|nr:LuxR C-terminal-related transcriptional regulator [Spirillospora sp.]